MTVTLDLLRRHAVARSLFAPTTLARAIARLGFVQADPIRAPARAQDLTLRHRVAGYRAGDLERRYPKLPIEEDFFVNYGFVPRATHALMHPRAPREAWTAARRRQAAQVLDFVRQRGVVHPREIDAEFAHGRTRNWFGGSSNASTLLLDGMHYRGMLRVAQRAGGTRMYAVREGGPAPTDPRAALDALVDVVVAKYAPLPHASLLQLVRHLCSGGVPQWQPERAAALERARLRLAKASIEGQDWYWPRAERLREVEPESRVRLLAPFDPVVWDRRRFEMFWGWTYRFEAYTPAPRRQLGYYALPMLWRDQVIGWANVTRNERDIQPQFGYVKGRPPREAGFRRELEAEVERMRAFLDAA